MTTGKTIDLTRQTFVGKAMSLLFNMLSRFITALLPRSKHLLISWLQSPSAVILEPKKIKSVTVSTVSPSICHEVLGLFASLSFLNVEFKPAFSLSSFASSRSPLVPLCFLPLNWYHVQYLRLLIFLPAILIPAYASSSPAFRMMHTTCKLNMQGDTIQPWCTPFPIWNQSLVPCLVLTVASWLAYTFLRRQVRWSGIPISFRIFYSLLWSTQSILHSQWSRSRCFFLEFSCFFYDPMDAGNLISGFSASSRSRIEMDC